MKWHDLVKMMLNLKTDCFLVMVGFSAKLSRQATYEVSYLHHFTIFRSDHVFGFTKQ